MQDLAKNWKLSCQDFTLLGKIHESWQDLDMIMARLVPWQDLAMIFPELARSYKILQDLDKIFNLGETPA